MADCKRCGRKLPAFSFGGLCAYCRQAENDDIQPGGHVSQLVPAWRVGPSVTMALMGINLAVFLVMLLNSVPPFDATAEQMYHWGGDLAQSTFNDEPWRVLTSVFVHGGLIHIATNMWCLWNIGRLAEQIYDKGAYVVIYLLCGLGGSLASLWATPDVVCVGASGAIFGIAGLLITTFWMGKLPIPREQTNATMSSLIAFAGYNLLFGAAIPGISNSAHIGGLFTGLILGGLMAPRLSRDSRESRGGRWLILGAVTVALVAVFQVLKNRFLAGS